MKDAEAIEEQAAEWLARREQRDLDSAELMAFEAWLAADPRHFAVYGELEAAWTALDGLTAYPRPTGDTVDPDILAPQRHRRRRFAPLALAVAAGMAAAAVLWLRVPTVRSPAGAAASNLAVNTSRFVRLSDGSEVELKAGSEVLEQFEPAIRRVRLTNGEAQFTVAKNPARPFIVEARGVDVRAVGTAFNVRMDPASIEVLVTEGKVRVNSPAALAAHARVAELIAGQCTTIATDGSPIEAPIRVQTVSSTQMDQLLAWQTSRLVFDSTPLAEVIARFNRHVAGVSHPHLVLADPELSGMRISGRFRADNAQDFVELLEASFGVAAERRGEDVLLRKQ